MKAVTLVIDIVAKLFKDFSYKCIFFSSSLLRLSKNHFCYCYFYNICMYWNVIGLAREMNINLPLELNFNQEAANIEKCRQILQPLIKTGELAIPEVYQSTQRILVMSFEEGCYLTDTEKIEEMKVDKGQVARLISKTFCEQMYLKNIFYS